MTSSASYNSSAIVNVVPKSEIKLSNLIALCFLLLVLHLATLAVYRVWFHPLSKFPGPKLAAITDYWELYQDFFREEGGYLFLELDNLHARYGPIVRIRPNEVHVKDSHWMGVLYPGTSEPRDRDPLVCTAMGSSFGTVGTAPYELHKVRRKALAPFFSSRSGGRMESQVNNHVKSMLVDLQTHVGEILDIRIYLYSWTTDFITEKIYNNSTKLFWDKKRAESFFRVVYDFTPVFPLTKHFPWMITIGFSVPMRVWKIVYPAYVPYVAIYKNLLELATEARLKYKSSKNAEPIDKNHIPDIFKVLLSSNLSDQDKMPKRMVYEAFSLLIAGSLTTTKTTTVAVFHTLKNVEVHEKLRAELKAAILDRYNMPSVAFLQKLPVLSSVIKETMRIGCIMATRFPMISPHKDLTYKNQIIPAGSSISMTFYKAGMDPDIFADPDTFRPERWLDGSQQASDYDRFVLPFGCGSHSCMGQALANAELYMLLAMLFRNFNLELYDTIRERDIDAKGSGPLGQPTRETKGVRVRVAGVVAD